MNSFVIRIVRRALLAVGSVLLFYSCRDSCFSLQTAVIDRRSWFLYCRPQVPSVSNEPWWEINHLVYVRSGCCIEFMSLVWTTIGQRKWMKESKLYVTVSRQSNTKKSLLFFFSNFRFCGTHSQIHFGFVSGRQPHHVLLIERANSTHHIV